MATLKINSAGVKTVWDEKNDKPLCTFKGGLLDTDDKALIAELEKRGIIEKGEKLKVEKEPSNDDRGTKSKSK